MSFQAIAVRQSVGASLSGQNSTPTITLPSAVAAGSTLVLIGSAIERVGDLTTLLNSVSDSQSNTWGTPTNVRLASSYVPNAFVCIAQNVAAGSPTITASMNQSAGVAVSWALLEVEKVPTSGVADKTVTGVGGDSTTEISTALSGTLTQTDNLAILCAGGFFGLPQNPTGWISVHTQQNGTLIGVQISHKKLTVTTSFSGTVLYQDGVNTTNTSAVMVVLKAAAAGATLRYRFLLNPSTFTTADTGITGYVWRNGDPDQVLAEKYTSLAGNATAGTLLITGVPGTASLGDSIVGSFYNSTDGSRPMASGTVEETP